jgi:hypothetical protein
MSVVHVISSTHGVYLYKSVNHLVVKGRVAHVKYELLGQTTTAGWDKTNKLGTR